MGIARVKQGFYYLMPHSKSHQFPMSKTLCSSSFSSSTKHQVSALYSNFLSNHHCKSSLWHKKIGHISMSGLQLVPNIGEIMNSSNDFFCAICPLAKQTKLQYPVSHLPLHQYLN